MSAVTLPPSERVLTAEELMALPDDGIDRELILGELRERPNFPRRWKESGIEANIVYLLGRWLDSQPKPLGMLHSGDAGFRLMNDPETLVGIDVAYVSAESVAERNLNLPFHDGPPALAVEILSPSDQHGDVVEKVGLYLEVGTVVWLIDPDLRTVQVHRPGHEPETFNVLQDLSGKPYLPGFLVPVAGIFGS